MVRLQQKIVPLLKLLLAIVLIMLIIENLTYTKYVLKRDSLWSLTNTVLLNSDAFERSNQTPVLQNSSYLLGEKDHKSGNLASVTLPEAWAPGEYTRFGSAKLDFKDPIWFSADVVGRPTRAADEMAPKQTIPPLIPQPACSKFPFTIGLSGKLGRDVSLPSPCHSWPEIESKLGTVLPGGRWRPSSCRASERMTIVIPYRDRDEHLRYFLEYMHPLFQRQQRDYSIIVVEQAPGAVFNRGIMKNIGFAEAQHMYNASCYVFHDIDLLPVDDVILYMCAGQPRHIGGFLDVWNFRLPYATLFGGVIAMTTEQFNNTNGYSNLFFGWGAEDDDLYNRVTVKCKYKVLRYFPRQAFYIAQGHKPSEQNQLRHKLLENGPDRWDNDGLNSLKYEVLKREKLKLFTWIYVSVHQEDYATQLMMSEH